MADLDIELQEFRAWSAGQRARGIQPAAESEGEQRYRLLAATLASMVGGTVEEHTCSPTCYDRAQPRRHR